MLTETVNVTTTGSAGSATGDGSTVRLRGLFYKIKLDYHASAPATTNVIVTTVNDAGVTVDTVLTIEDSATDDTYSPVINTHTNVGLATGNYILEDIPIGTVKVSVTDSDALTNAVVATIHYIPLGSVQNKGT